MPAKWVTTSLNVPPPATPIEKPAESRPKYYYRIEFWYFDDVRYSTEKFEYSEFEALAKALREMKTAFRFERWCDCPGMQIRIHYIG